MADREITPAEAIELQRQALANRDLLVWTITYGTSDKGERYTVRAAWVQPLLVHTLNAVMHADSLDELRAKLPPGLTRMEPDPDDSKVIVEIWL